jgi:hypothetical protein
LGAKELVAKFHNFNKDIKPKLTDRHTNSSLYAIKQVTAFFTKMGSSRNKNGKWRKCQVIQRQIDKMQVEKMVS